MNPNRFKSMYGHEPDTADSHIQIRRPLQSVERVGISASSHPAKPVQPAKPASQASQPARPASRTSRASKPQASRHRCQQFFFIGAPTRALRGAQGATGRITFWQPQHQGGAAKHATNPSNIDDMTNFPSNRVMGRPFHGFRVPIKIL